MARILVVDDNDQIRNLVGELLRFEGHHVASAGNGTQALAALREDSFDLLITDIIMPEIDGLETIRSLRTDSRIPIVAISAAGKYSPNDRLGRAVALGANAVLYKPFSKNELLAAVQPLLRCA